MNRLERNRRIRASLTAGRPSVGSWMQLANSSVAEVMGQAGYDWVAVDMEHGSIGVAQLPDIFRALELGDTQPLVRIARSDATLCKDALDAGAGGVIVPMIESAVQLEAVRDACRWPPAGSRGVGFSRANLFGKHFEAYAAEAQAPLLVAMIEHIRAVDDLDEILGVAGLDAILVGPYDLSASMGRTAQFDRPEFRQTLDRIRAAADMRGVASGIHVVTPSPAELERRVQEGYRFLPFGIDALFLHTAAQNPRAGISPAP